MKIEDNYLKGSDVTGRLKPISFRDLLYTGKIEDNQFQGSAVCSEDRRQLVLGICCLQGRLKTVSFRDLLYIGKIEDYQFRGSAVCRED